MSSETKLLKGYVNCSIVLMFTIIETLMLENEQILKQCLLSVVVLV